MPTDKPVVSPDEENLWSKVLQEVQSKSAIGLPQGAVLVLGNNESGKTSLIAKLNRVEEPKKGAGLEYHYLEVNQDYTDGSYAYQLGSALPDVGPGESTRVGVWVVDGDDVFAPLLRFALSADTFERSVVVLTASMQQPWSILDSLQRWVRLLQDHTEFQSSTSSGCIDENLLREGKERQVRFWQEYLEPLDSSMHGGELGIKVPSMETDHVLLPLGESTLTTNIGIPIIVVITKCDTMPTIEKDHDYKEEHWDFIQQHIRKFCLNYGAALVYTSVKEARNCDILYKYLLHRIYGFPFTLPALVVDKDAVFIPTGWDNEKKISILHENLTTMKADDCYSEHIKKPAVGKRAATGAQGATGDAEVLAEEEQLFLQRQQTVLASKSADAGGGQQLSPKASRKPPQTAMDSSNPLLPARTKPLLSSASTTAVASAATSAAAAKDGKAPSLSGAGGGGDGGTALAQFFNNLLQKGGNPPPTHADNPTPPTSLNTSKSFDVRTQDAEVELQRMLSSKGGVAATDADQNSNRKSSKTAAAPRQPKPTAANN